MIYMTPNAFYIEPFIQFLILHVDFQNGAAKVPPTRAGSEMIDHQETGSDLDHRGLVATFELQPFRYPGLRHHPAIGLADQDHRGGGLPHARETRL